MTKLYLIRHAEAEGNLYRIAQGQYNSILTDRGCRQVEALERRFAEISVDAVYSSDLYRTCATASAIYRPKGLHLNRRRDLREICVGKWEQRTWGDIAREDPEQMENFSHHLERWHVDGAETPEQVRDRVLSAVQEIAAENEGRTVAVFSHGCAIRILLATLQGLSIAQLGETAHGDNTAVSLLEVENGVLRVVFRDDNSHLRGPMFAAGETVRKRANALEPGLYFQPLHLPEEELFLTDCGQAAWADAGESRTWAMETMLQDARSRPGLVGILAGEPVGLLQLHPEKEAAENCGWLSLAYIRRDCRCRGFGVQLLGQAVAYYRPLGRERLRLALADGNETARRFFTEYGFFSAGRTADGREVLEKNIRFCPEFLSE